MNINANFTSTTEIHNKVKNYSLSYKLKRFIVLFIQTFCTCGFVLTSKKFRRRWVKLFSVHSRNKQLLKITRVALKQNVAFDQKQKDLSAAKMQLHLNAMKIPLNCINPPKQKDLNDFNKGEINKYLSKAKIKDPSGYDSVKLKLDALDKITVKELDENLRGCPEYLNTQLNENYDVGFVEEKSSKWIAELALPYLSRGPSHYFEHGTDKGGKQSTLNAETRKFVIFDDASYSGKQIVSLIKSFQKQIFEQEKKGELFLVVPFISNHASEYIISKISNSVNTTTVGEHNAKLKVHIITSNRKIKEIKDVEPNSKNSGCLTFTEWKIPDMFSLSERLCVKRFKEDNKHLHLLTDYPPCYKS